MDEKKFMELYQRQKESGLTVKEFCSNEIIAPATFYYWQKKLKSCNRLPGFIPVVVKPSTAIFQESSPGNSFSTTTQLSTTDIPVEIEFPNKTVLRIGNVKDMAILRALIHLND